MNIDIFALLALAITVSIYLVTKHKNNEYDYKEYLEDNYKQKFEISQKIINNEYVTDDEYKIHNIIYKLKENIQDKNQ
jgi:hypothetical protein